MLYMRIHSHQILVNVRFRVPYLYHTSSRPTMQRPTRTFTITLTLTKTLHLLLYSQLVTRDELTYWRVDQTLTSAGCPLSPYRLAFWSTANRGPKGTSGDAQWVTEILGRQGRNEAGNISICFKGKCHILTLKCSKIDFFQLMLGELTARFPRPPSYRFKGP